MSNNTCTQEYCINESHLYYSTRSVIEYNDIAKKLIKLFKFQAKFELLRLFRNWFNCLLEELNHKDIDYVMPVPLHKNKLKARGYNQAAILAKSIARIINKKYESKILIKAKDTPNQSNLSKQARRNNLVNSFYIDNKNIHNIYNKKILLVDDVITTCNTINECSKILIKNGVSRIDVVSIARR